MILNYLSILSTLRSGCDRATSAADLEVAEGVKELTAKFKALIGLMPDHAHIMADVGYHGRFGPSPSARTTRARTSTSET